MCDMSYGDDIDTYELNELRDTEVAKTLRKERVVFLDDTVGDRLALEISKLFLVFATSKKRVTLYINSPGGSVPSMFRIINMMESARFPITTVGCGWVCSAALDIFITGDTRLLWPNSTLLSHQSQDFADGKVEDVEQAAKEMRRVEARILDHYERHTALTREEITKYLMPEHDIYVSPEEALLFGMCDRIIEPTKNRKKLVRTKKLQAFLARSARKGK